MGKTREVSQRATREDDERQEDSIRERDGRDTALKDNKRDGDKGETKEVSWGRGFMMRTKS
jgi:hypothetical protein